MSGAANTSGMFTYPSVRKRGNSEAAEGRWAVGTGGPPNTVKSGHSLRQKAASVALLAVCKRERAVAEPVDIAFSDWINTLHRPHPSTSPDSASSFSFPLHCSAGDSSHFVPAPPVNVAPYRYRLCDFVLETELALPELNQAPPTTAAAVRVRRGETPPALPEARQTGVCFAAQPNTLLCWLAGVARFHVVEGREIVIEAAPQAADEAVRSLLFSSPLAGLLLQRGLLPLHGSCVASPAGALVFLGSPGAGKSTLAAEFRRRGFQILADDITALRVAPQARPSALPVSSSLRLWPSALASTLLNADGSRLRPQIDKRILVGADQPSRDEAVPLRGIFCLERGSRAPGGGACRRLLGAGVLAALLDAVYRPAFVRGLGLEQSVFSQLSSLAASTPIFRPIAADGESPDALAEGILKAL